MNLSAVLTRFLIIFLIINISIPVSTKGFGILTHEAVIDASWEKLIVPLLKKKFPGSTSEQLQEAHAYVYGGSIIPDIGYHPFGSILFTHLFHYVRTGDFVEALIDEADSLNEYAFAIGALCHYIADSYGHPIGTNRAVPLLFPNLKKKYGESVTYEQARIKHVRVEYGFDVLQTAKGKYVSDSYHNFIDFKMSEPVLARAFLKTYGLELKSVFNSFPISVETFRFTVKSIIPEMTRDAWKIRKSTINKLNPLATEENFYYKMKRKDYNKEYGRKFSLKSAFLSVILGVFPKVGPLAMFRFKEPTPEVEELYNKSFQIVVKNYTVALNRLMAGENSFQNVDLDTGNKISRDEYNHVNKTYAKLLLRLKKNKFENVDSDLKNNIIAFYTHKKADSPLEENEKVKEDDKLERALNELRTATR
jgi:hypothetical protein